MSKHIAAYGNEIVYLRDDDDADETAPTTTVFRSKDYGATWRRSRSSKAPCAARYYDENVDVARGPEGLGIRLLALPEGRALRSVVQPPAN